MNVNFMGREILRTAVTLRYFNSDRMAYFKQSDSYQDLNMRLLTPFSRL